MTANDLGDGDAGANDQLNFPVIDGASLAGGITGEARPGATVEFYISEAADSNGEGQTYFLSTTASGANGTTDTSAKQFAVSFGGGVIAGNKITAIAIDAQGNTSEFAVNFTVLP